MPVWCDRRAFRDFALSPGGAINFMRLADTDCWCAQILDSRDITWHPVAAFHPPLLRRLSASNRFSARLARDGFHALRVLPSRR
jgi:hypothetical protein